PTERRPQKGRLSPNLCCAGLLFLCLHTEADDIVDVVERTEVIGTTMGKLIEVAALLGRTNLEKGTVAGRFGQRVGCRHRPFLERRDRGTAGRVATPEGAIGAVACDYIAATGAVIRRIGLGNAGRTHKGQSAEEQG